MSGDAVSAAAETIRDALVTVGPKRDAAEASVDALVAEVERLRAERDGSAFLKDAAEAKVRRLEHQLVDATREWERETAELEARVQQLQEALAPFVAATTTTEIPPEAGGRDFTLRVTGLNIRRARAALAATPTEG